MTKRANGEASVNGDADHAKRLRTTVGESSASSESDLDAEWAAFQAIIAETKEPNHEEVKISEPSQQLRTDKATIELDEEDEFEDEELEGTWDAEEFNIDKRLEEQEKRKQYLQRLRDERDKKLKDVSPPTLDERDEAGREDSDFDIPDEDLDEKGWF